MNIQASLGLIKEEKLKFLLTSLGDFPIDFEEVLELVGIHKRKENAKRLLLKHFIKDLDYSLLTERVIFLKNGGKRKYHKIHISIYCFISYVVLIKTPEARHLQKLISMYYLNLL